MSEIFEAAMIICFGISWPVSIYKSLSSKTAKGKSLLFMFLILIGYVFGIIGKLAAGKITYVFVFYLINFAMISVDVFLYFRNRSLDRKRDMTNLDPPGKSG